MKYEISRLQIPNAKADQQPEKERKTIGIDCGVTVLSLQWNTLEFTVSIHRPWAIFFR